MTWLWLESIHKLQTTKLLTQDLVNTMFVILFENIKLIFSVSVCTVNNNLVIHYFLKQTECVYKFKFHV